jgi:hypothetical protein
LGRGEEAVGPQQKFPGFFFTNARNAPTSAIDSTIISDFLENFAEFRGKQFSLLWCGGHESFRVKNFHGRCDCHTNTLTLIEDTKGSLFYGFAPLDWESGSGMARSQSLTDWFTAADEFVVPPSGFVLVLWSSDDQSMWNAQGWDSNGMAVGRFSDERECRQIKGFQNQRKTFTKTKPNKCPSH